MSTSNNFFYEEGGKKQDVALHNPVLDAGDEALAFSATLPTLREHGFTDADLRLIYGDLFDRAVKYETTNNRFAVRASELEPVTAIGDSSPPVVEQGLFKRGSKRNGFSAKKQHGKLL